MLWENLIGNIQHQVCNLPLCLYQIIKLDCLGISNGLFCQSSGLENSLSLLLLCRLQSVLIAGIVAFPAYLLFCSVQGGGSLCFYTRLSLLQK